MLFDNKESAVAQKIQSIRKEIRDFLFEEAWSLYDERQN